MTGVRAAKARETRARLLDTARRLFTENGYYVTGTEEIVERAGVGTRGALYHHFTDKRELFEAVFEQVELDLADRAAVVVTAETGFDRLVQALDAFLDASLDGEVRRIILVDGPSVLGWDRWREIEARHGLGAIEGMLKAGVKDGSMTVPDPQAVSHLLLSAVDEAALFIAHAKQPRKARTRAGASLRALLSGLASPSA
jgi:AcrR family transcriptional regulator